METLEHLAPIALGAEMLGGPRVLPRVEIEKLLEAHPGYRIRVPKGSNPAVPWRPKTCLTRCPVCKRVER